MIKGFISYYRLKKGIGFISAEDGCSYFFHISKMLDENAYQGSPVQFETETAEEKSDKAVDIMTLSAEQNLFGAIKFHNHKEMFGSIYAAGGDCAFTQVTNSATFTPGQLVTFAMRPITMPDGETKRIAFDIAPLPDKQAARGVITAWDGASGTLRSADKEFAFDAASVHDPSVLKEGLNAEAALSNGNIVFLRGITQEPGIIGVARVVNINLRQNYALVSGPGIPRAIIGNPSPALRHGSYISGEFIKNVRGFECIRHSVVPADRILHGHVIDGGTKVRLINCGDYPPLELPRNVLLGRKDVPWTPQDGDVCECLLNAEEHIAIARKGYALRCFAELGDEDQMLEELAAKAHPGDRWDFMSSSVRVKPILWNYLFQTFAKLNDEDIEHGQDGTLPCIMDFHIPTAENPRDAGDYAAFNTGLINRFYQDIFALFKKVPQPQPGRPLYRLLAFDVRGTGHGQLLAYLDPLPRRARYFNTTTELVFDTETRIDTNYEHILSDRSYRLIPDEELQRDSDRETIARRLSPILQNAIRTVQNRIRWNYKTAVPQYYPAKKKIQFLLPLCMDPGVPDKIDAVLVVEKVGKVYQAFTVLRPDWAYNNARLIARTDSDWLTPSKIMAGDTSDMF